MYRMFNLPPVMQKVIILAQNQLDGQIYYI
jgi:hypothetical protein